MGMTLSHGGGEPVASVCREGSVKGLRDPRRLRSRPSRRDARSRDAVAKPTVEADAVPALVFSPSMKLSGGRRAASVGKLAGADVALAADVADAVAPLPLVARLHAGDAFVLSLAALVAVALRLATCARILAPAEIRTTIYFAYALRPRALVALLHAIGHELIAAGRSVLFAPTFKPVQDLLAGKRDLALPRALRKFDRFEVIILNDIGYVKQSPEEIEVLFTLLVITSNLVFSEWDQIFQNPMTTAVAIERLVHHSVVLEFDVESCRSGPKEAA